MQGDAPHFLKDKTVAQTAMPEVEFHHERTEKMNYILI